MSDQTEIERINEWLAVPSAAETAIAFATEPQQSRTMESVSAAAIAWAREQNQYEMTVNATRLYVLARRKTTELLLADNMRVTDGMQFTPMQWSRRMKEYNVPADTLDGYFDHCIANGWNPSIAGMLREAYHTEGNETMKYYKDALYIAAERAYKSEIVDTDMVWVTIGENNDFATKEEWIKTRIDEWLEQAAIERSK